jgi:thiamine-phosphate pyrophosphorylase
LRLAERMRSTVNIMKFEYSPALQLAFDRARQVAAADRAADIAPRHLLRGLLAEDEGMAAMVLARHGTDWPRLQAHLGLPMLLDSSPPPELPLHASLRVVMLQARDLAIHHGEEGSIVTDHVLLALLSVFDSLRKELETFGLDFQGLRQSIVGEAPPLVLEEPLNLQEPTEEADAARILDANANRAREALRVLEDYTRFALNDAYLSGALKNLRHDFTQAVQLLPAPLLLEARHTEGDVGTSISTDTEMERASLGAVVQANVKRLQEALRSLEEYGKVLHSEFALRIEQIRYRSYTLEQALVRGQSARDRLATAQLYVLVTESLCRASLVGTVKETLLGGAQIIQLREKDLDDRTLLTQAREIRKLTQDAGALFIMNDRPDIARLAEADGVHLGQDDLPVREARRILGPEALIGVSTHHLDQLHRAILDGASYVGVGPTFPSQTKDFADFAGLDFVRQACAETTLPAFAIGGIQLDNLAQVLAAGARRVAVSRALCAADDPRLVSQRLREALAAA